MQQRRLTPHEILGLASASDRRTVRRAFRRRARETHPDQNPGDPTAAERFKAVVWAYEQLLGSPTVPRAKGSAWSPPCAPAAPFECGGCGDGYTQEGACPRCECPVDPRGRVRKQPVDPRVEQWELAVLSRAERRAPAGPAPPPELAAGFMVMSGVAMGCVGPPQAAAMMAGFGLWVMAVATHGRFSRARELRRGGV